MTSTFHPFPRLPLELQRQIWRCTVESRTVEVRVEHWKPDRDPFLISSTPVPGPLQCCRVARDELQRLYQRAFFDIGTQRNTERRMYATYWYGVGVESPPSPSRPSHLSSPKFRVNRHHRRNSEPTMVDRRPFDPPEEHRPQGLYLIDKLDVTGIYGPSMIHHDGPYDAVQPHRNRKKDQRAPMHAFPVGSANNTLGGSGPLNTKIDLDRIHGRGAEGFTDFAGAETEWKKPAPVAAEFSAKGREDIVHGEQTHGLGTSTFLEGAPASRKAIQEESDAQRQKQLAEGGLGRKKSIAQRFRGISQPRRYGDGPRITSPEARYGSATSPSGPYSAGAISQTKATEQNPFFSDDYDKAYDAKGATIKTNEGGPSPPRGAALQRSITTDSVGSPTGEGKPSGGFLNRVKSLKGGRRRPA